jgi:hypothetical protein
MICRLLPCAIQWRTALQQVCLHFHHQERSIRHIPYTECPKKLYTLFTHQYLWNKFRWEGENVIICFFNRWHRRYTSYTGWSTENIAMSCAAITLDTLQNVVQAAVSRLRLCLDADGGHFEHLHWIQNSRTSLISILLLYTYSSYDYRVMFFMSKCVYIILGHSVYTGLLYEQSPPWKS